MTLSCYTVETEEPYYKQFCGRVPGVAKDLDLILQQPRFYCVANPQKK